jgi:hypothetical protein
MTPEVGLTVQPVAPAFVTAYAIAPLPLVVAKVGVAVEDVM